MTPAEELIAAAKALLLDFDGPVTTLMPPPLNAQAADQARAALSAVELPDEIATTTDHLAVMRFTAEQIPGRLSAVERSCTEVEVACARESDPSPEVLSLVAGAEQRAMPVAIVSNNSEAAVRVFLDRFEWGNVIKALSCRTATNVYELKPHPHLVERACRLVRNPPESCVFVGDSVSDMRAGKAVGVRLIGLAKNPARGTKLVEAGAEALIHRHGTW